MGKWLLEKHKDSDDMQSGRKGNSLKVLQSATGSPFLPPFSLASEWHDLVSSEWPTSLPHLAGKVQDWMKWYACWPPHCHPKKLWDATRPARRASSLSLNDAATCCSALLSPSSCCSFSAKRLNKSRSLSATLLSHFTTFFSVAISRGGKFQMEKWMNFV